MRNYIFMICLCSSQFIYSQTLTDTVRLTFIEAIDYAKTHAPGISNADVDVASAQQKVKEIKSAGLPQINGTGQYLQYGIIPGNWAKNFFAAGQPGAPEYIFLKFQQQYNLSGTLSLNQLIFDGSYIVGLKASTEFINVSKMIQTKSVFDAQVNAAKAYAMAVSTQKNIALIDENIVVLNSSLKDISAMNKEGFVEKLEVQKLELTLENLKLQREKLLNAVAITKNLVKMAIGMDIRQPLVLLDNLEAVDASIKLNENVVLADSANLKNRLEYQLLNQQLKLSILDEQRYKYGYLPSVFGFIQGSRSTARSEFNFFKSNLTPNNNFVPSLAFGLQLSVPIFDGFRKKTQIQQVKLGRLKTLNDIHNFGNAVQLEFSNAKLSYNTNIKSLSMQKKMIDLSKEIYNKANIKFKEGVGSSLEIIQAQGELKNAQINYLNAIYDVILSKMDLKKAMGETAIN